ncbi:MAG: M20/M25/M40 family metallo-hydrolase [Candidatus Kariarchaeaceae archaeon]|jgi:acetylornithine deacetylase/succinyl-diaminopimelate desuccinylase-like protein
MSDIIDILEKLVAYDTRTNETTPALEGKKLLENEIEPRLIECGFQVEYFESEGHHSILGVKPGSSPSILYSGHIDVVPWDDRWTYPPQQVTKTSESGEEVVIGRGVSDMKGGVAALMAALPRLAESDSTLLFAITADEEIAGENGTKIIVEHLVVEGTLPDFVITADAAGMEIITRRRNVFDLVIKSKKLKKKMRGFKHTKTFQTTINSGPTSHAAYFRKEQDSHCVKIAAEYLAEQNATPSNIQGKFVKVNVLPDTLDLDFVVPSEEGEEFEVDVGLGHLLKLANNLMEIDFETEADSDYGINSTANVIDDDDDHWRLQVDIRAMLSEDADELDGALLLILDEFAYDFDIEVNKSIGYIATLDESPLVTGTTRILGNLGYPTAPAERGGATDGRFFAQHNIPTIDIGAIGWNVHGPDETATVKSLRDIVKFFEESSHAITADYRKK